MSFIIADRTQETTNTTGTGTITLAGAISGFRTFSAGVGSSNSTYYTLIDGNGIDWEVGTGTVGSGTLSRDTVITSSNANSAITLSVFAPHYVFADSPAIALQLISSIASHTILANVTGSAAAPSPSSISSILDLLSSTQGVIAYRGASNWEVLSPGTSGQFLQTQGASANPIWASAVVSVTAGTGLAGGTITGTGTISLATIADASVLANISGGSAVPSANTLTAVIDYTLGNVQGQILYRNGTVWTTLSPGTSGQFLQTQGTAANPSWASFSLGGLPAQANNTILSNISGISATPLANTLSAIVDSAISSTQGVILYRSSSDWSALATGTSGQFLKTLGASANPQWATLAYNNLPTISNNTILSNISGITAVPSANTLSDIIDNLFGFGVGVGQGAVFYRGASVWSALLAGTNGLVLTSGGSSVNPAWSLVALTSLATQANNTIVSNISGGSTAPIANTLTAIIDTIDNTQGDILYRGASAWVVLGPGTSGQLLATQGAAANPHWVTFGLANLPTQTNNTILSNISGITAVPSANTLTAIIDSCIDNTQGDILYRSGTIWTNLAAGTSGQYLKTQGASSNPVWSTIALSSLATQTNNTILSNISGITAVPSANTLTAIIDTISATQGVILYRGSSTWAALATGTSGSFLMTQGTSANPIWQTLGYSNLPSEIQNSLAQVSIPGLMPTSSKVMIVPIVQNTQVPANFAGSGGYCFGNASGSFIFTVGYIHSGSPTTIGTITFSSGGGTTPALSTQALINLVSGDTLYISTQAAGDGTLSDVGITLLLLKQ